MCCFATKGLVLHGKVSFRAEGLLPEGALEGLFGEQHSAFDAKRCFVCQKRHSGRKAPSYIERPQK
eukprot:10414645-Alexandrium_andersonii.AAC.1